MLYQSEGPLKPQQASYNKRKQSQNNDNNNETIDHLIDHLSATS